MSYWAVPTWCFETLALAMRLGRFWFAQVMEVLVQKAIDLWHPNFRPRWDGAKPVRCCTSVKLNGWPPFHFFLVGPCTRLSWIWYMLHTCHCPPKIHRRPVVFWWQMASWALKLEASKRWQRRCWSVGHDRSSLSVNLTSLLQNHQYKRENMLS